MSCREELGQRINYKKQLSTLGDILVSGMHTQNLHHKLENVDGTP